MRALRLTAALGMNQRDASLLAMAALMQTVEDTTALKRCVPLGLATIRNEVQNVARHRESSKDFTRQRGLPFPKLVLFLMNLLKSAIQYELNSFYSLLEGRDIPQRELTQSAFTQARKKLKFEAFVEPNDQAPSTFYANAPIKR